MLTLSPNECRVLGTLVEKAQTTPGQYPLTINALTAGCNQKNNREPVTNLSEEEVFDAVDALRGKQLVREVMLSGSRVSKFRHVAREVFAVTTEDLVVLTELWLRGPQSAGELRGHATRMHPLESLDSVQAVLHGLASRPEPFARELPTRPGERAPRWVQLICPDLHPEPAFAPASPQQAAPVASGLAERVAKLEVELEDVKILVRRLAASLGEPIR